MREIQFPVITAGKNTRQTCGDGKSFRLRDESDAIAEILVIAVEIEVRVPVRSERLIVRQQKSVAAIDGNGVRPGSLNQILTSKHCFASGKIQLEYRDGWHSPSRSQRARRSGPSASEGLMSSLPQPNHRLPQCSD